MTTGVQGMRTAGRRQRSSGHTAGRGRLWDHDFKEGHSGARTDVLPFGGLASPQQEPEPRGRKAAVVGDIARLLPEFLEEFRREKESKHAVPFPAGEKQGEGRGGPEQVLRSPGVPAK